MLSFDSREHYQAFVAARAVHNKRQKRVTLERRRRLLALVQSGQFEPKASQALADALGAGRTTVWQDLQALDLEASRCPHCGQLLPAAFELALATAGD